MKWENSIQRNERNVTSYSRCHGRSLAQYVEKNELHNKILINHKVQLLGCPFLSVVCKLDALESGKLTARLRKSYAMFVYR